MRCDATPHRMHALHICNGERSVRDARKGRKNGRLLKPDDQLRGFKDGTRTCGSIPKLANATLLGKSSPGVIRNVTLSRSTEIINGKSAGPIGFDARGTWTSDTYGSHDQSQRRRRVVRGKWSSFFCSGRTTKFVLPNAQFGHHSFPRPKTNLFHLKSFESELKAIVRGISSPHYSFPQWTPSRATRATRSGDVAESN